MKKCNKCNVLIDTDRKTCPLCFEILKQVDETTSNLSLYPKPESMIVAKSIFLRILSFLTVIGIFTSIIVNVLTYKRTPIMWSLIVILGAGYFWILIRSTFRGKGHVPLRLVIQMMALSALTYGIDRISNYSGWSLNYVIPFLSMASILSIISILIGNGFKFSDYLLYLFAAILLGFLPFILWVFNIVEVLWPSLSAASLSFSTTIGMLIFADSETKEEIKKRFHI